MKNCIGWLLDLYPSPESGVVLWIITQTGKRICLHQPLMVEFSIAGPSPRLRSAWQWLRHQPIPVKLERSQGRDLFLTEPVTLLNIQTDAAYQPRLFAQLFKAFPDLDYYNSDIQLSLRHAALFNTFPLARCEIEYDAAGTISHLRVLDSPWETDPQVVPLRILNLDSDIDPQYAPPQSLLVYDSDKLGKELPLDNSRKLLDDLAEILTNYDPDILITAYGDSWILPYLIKISDELNFSLPLNRDLSHKIIRKNERSYFSYGHIVFNNQQIHLFGRLHLDKKNSFLFKDCGLEGVLESARVTALPIQTSARTSPGTGISSMQVLTALRNQILVPWHKQQVEHKKTAAEMISYDQGGLVYQPKIGLHHNVAELDFISMYPSVMVKCNISPETSRPDHLGSDAEPGLVPLTLKPLLDKRVKIKLALGSMPTTDPRYKRYMAASATYKWLLVTCFGYLGYKNAKFGRIESHESVTMMGREALLTAKETAEDMGYEILHMYVDALWVVKDGISRPDQLNPLLDAISERTGLSIALDGIYRWLAFLPSRADDRVAVPNRYFGVFQDGSVKFRGIEARRGDMPPFITDTQIELVKILASAKSPVQLDYSIRRAELFLQQRVLQLRRGQIPLNQLVISQRLSRELSAYKSPSPAARALKQLQSIGQDKKPGQKVRFLYTLTQEGVHAWDLPEKPLYSQIDTPEYEKLLQRAVQTVFYPFAYRPSLVKETAYQECLC